MASRSHRNESSRGNEPGTGLQACGRLDYQLKLQAKQGQGHAFTHQERLEMRETPVEINGVQYLGWVHMPPHVAAQFLGGCDFKFVVVAQRVVS